MQIWIKGEAVIKVTVLLLSYTLLLKSCFFHYLYKSYGSYYYELLHNQLPIIKFKILTFPVAARSKVSVCSRSPAEIVVWNPTRAAWMSVCCECCVLSGRGICNELITRPEEYYWLWRVVVCDLKTSWMRRLWPHWGGVCRVTENKVLNIGESLPDDGNMKNVGAILDYICIYQTCVRFFL